MSFRDVMMTAATEHPPAHQQPHFYGGATRYIMPKVQVEAVPDDEEDSENPTTTRRSRGRKNPTKNPTKKGASKKPKSKKPNNKPILVMHGRVLHENNGYSLTNTEDFPDAQLVLTSTSTSLSSTSPSKSMLSESSSNTTASSSPPVHKTTSLPSSPFARLVQECRVFAKMVAELDGLVSEKNSLDHPEVAWRVRILMQSAQDTDALLHKNLGEFLLSSTNQQQHYAAKKQTSCGIMKLQRDYRRTHRFLQMTISNYERLQKAQVSALVGARKFQEETASTTGGIRSNEDHDSWERRMRQKELDDMNTSMHQVHDLYKELATHVNDQQDNFDQLEENLNDSRNNVESAVQHITCFAERHNYAPCEGGTGGGGGGGHGQWLDCGAGGGDIPPTTSFPEDTILQENTNNYYPTTPIFSSKSCFVDTGILDREDNTIRLNDEDEDLLKSDCDWRASFEQFKLLREHPQTILCFADPNDISFETAIDDSSDENGDENVEVVVTEFHERKPKPTWLDTVQGDMDALRQDCISAWGQVTTLMGMGNDDNDDDSIRGNNNATNTASFWRDIKQAWSVDGHQNNNGDGVAAASGTSASAYTSAPRRHFVAL